MRYDITLPLLDGRVEIAGVNLKPDRGPGSMVFADNAAQREGDFGVADLNLGYLLPALEAGWQIAALPVFSKRKTALQFISSGSAPPAASRRLATWREGPSRPAPIRRR